MKAYWITRCHVHNTVEYEEYIKLAGPAIQKHGGTFLVRGGDQIELEGGPYERTVLVEFNSTASTIENVKVSFNKIHTSLHT